jgi:hypothetical protein
MSSATYTAGGENPRKLAVRYQKSPEIRAFFRFYYCWGTWTRTKNN